jgi:hypothetical protein
MATLTIAELATVRQQCAVQFPTPTWTKTQLNAAAQACEDFLENNAATVSAAINAATSPLTLTAAQKKKLFAEVVERKYLRDK